MEKSGDTASVKHHFSFIVQRDPLPPMKIQFIDRSHDPGKAEQFCEPAASFRATIYLKFCKIWKTGFQRNEKEQNFVLNIIIHRGF